MNKEKEGKILYFKCPECKKVVERHSSNPFIGFLNLYCDSYCEKADKKYVCGGIFKWIKKK